MKVGVYTGTSNAAPFVIKEGNKYSGIAIDIWERVAKDLDIDFYYIKAEDDLELAIDDLRDGLYDILIGPISMNESRFEKVDFTYPWFLSNVSLLKQKSSGDKEVTMEIVKLIAVIFILTFILTTFNSVFTQILKKTPFMSALKNTILNIISGKISKLPKTKEHSFLKFVNVLIIILGILFILKSFKTIMYPTEETIDPKQYIKNKKVVVEFESTPLEVSRKLKAVPKQVFVDPKKVKPGKDLKLDEYLQDPSEYAGVVEQEAYLKHYLDNGDKRYDNLEIVKGDLGLEVLAFPIQKKSPVLSKINQKLQENQNSRIHEIIATKYVGAKLARNANF
tara:strand:- start:8542 stop:9549 length:1008 start_codon:yes stop_codon:yes gene_type:complete